MATGLAVVAWTVGAGFFLATARARADLVAGAGEGFVFDVVFFDALIV
jgi:hypothetical protein